MKAKLSFAALTMTLLFSCNRAEVDNRGSYKFLPGTPGIDTAPYPLSTLLIVEEDAESERTLFYLFEGELGQADLGIEDLRRVAADFGFADIRFDYPLSHYDFGAGSGAGGEGGAAGAAGGAGAPGTEAVVPEPVKTLTVDGRVVDLYAVDDLLAFELGVTRFLAAIQSTDYEVRAYWGALAGADGFRSLEFSSGTRRLSHQARLRPTEVSVSSEDDELVVGHDELRGADYKIVDLYQKIVRDEDGARLDALVSTSYGVATEYRASSDLLSSVWSGLCWSVDKALFARVEQVARSYYVEPKGDFAVIHERRDFVEVPPEAWQGSAPEAGLFSYCDNYH